MLRPFRTNFSFGAAWNVCFLSIRYCIFLNFGCCSSDKSSIFFLQNMSKKFTSSLPFYIFESSIFIWNRRKEDILLFALFSFFFFIHHKPNWNQINFVIDRLNLGGSKEGRDDFSNVVQVFSSILLSFFLFYPSMVGTSKVKM